MNGSVPDWDLYLDDEAATEALGRRLAALMAPGTLILLEGPLGAGKTCLVRGLVRGLGGDPAEVGSPTFVLMEAYSVTAGNIARVYHADLYRLRGMRSAPWEEVGLGEVMDDPAGVTAVEWPAGWEWESFAPGPIIHVRLAPAGSGRAASVRFNA